MKGILDVRKILPSVMCLGIIISELCAQDLPLIPILSEKLKSEVEIQKAWKKQTILSSKLPYFSQHSENLALEQYNFNAKIFLLKFAIQGLFLPMKKLELQTELFEANFFELTKKYCQQDAKTGFDWGGLARQIYLLEKNAVHKSRWDDAWSKANLPLEFQQRFYTSRMTKSLDAVRALCLREDNPELSLVRYFLKDQVLAQRFSSFISDESSVKYFCDSSIFCRQVDHKEFVERLPRAILDLSFEQEMVGAWKTFVQDFVLDWDALKKKHPFLSNVSTQRALLQLHDEALSVSDFFHVTTLLSRDSKKTENDPILYSIRPVLDQLVSEKIERSAKKVVWEEPLEVNINPKVNFQEDFAMEIKAHKGGMDQMIDKIEKFKISDQIQFERGFLEWFLRATLNIRYYNEQLYWSNRESIERHLKLRFDSYVAQRKTVFPYLSMEKSLSSLMTEWFFNNRNDIADYLVSNPDQKVFSLKIHHFLGLSALETSTLTE